MKGKNCTNQLPTARLRLHSPEQPWRKHVDTTINVKGDTDLDLFAGLIINYLSALSYTALPPLYVGFFIDVVNHLPIDMRRNIAAGIVAGLTTQFDFDTENNTLTVEHVPFYPPVPLPTADETGTVAEGFVERESGLSVPEGSV
jgi:hypothetical protein